MTGQLVADCETANQLRIAGTEEALHHSLRRLDATEPRCAACARHVCAHRHPALTVEDTVITTRDEDFIRFVLEDTASRRVAEEQFYAAMDGSAA